MYKKAIGIITYYLIIAVFYFKVAVELCKKNSFLKKLKNKLLKIVHTVNYDRGSTQYNIRRMNFLFKAINFQLLLYAKKYNLFLFARIDDSLRNEKLHNQIELLRITKSYPYGKAKYKKFDLVGQDVKIRLRGGNSMYSNDVHTLLVKDGNIAGSVQGVIHKRRLISIIETEGSFDEFGCFKNRTIKFITKKLVFIFKSFKKKRNKVIFFGANRGYSSNYFHFMLDALPSLLCTMQTIKHKRTDWHDFVVIVPEDIHDNIKKIVHKCCEYYGYKTKSFGFLEWIDCSYVAFTGYPTFMKNPLPIDVNYSVSPVLTRFTKIVLSKVFHTPRSKNDMLLYSTRGDGKNTSTTRHVINYQDVSNHLKDLNFTTINPTNMDLASQVENFNNAKVIILDGGAAIANLLFSKNCKHVVVLAMSEGTDPSLFVSFAQALGIKITYFCGNSKHVPFVPSWHLSYKIDVYLLKEYVYKLLNSA